MAIRSLWGWKGDGDTRGEGPSAPPPRAPLPPPRGLRYHQPITCLRVQCSSRSPLPSSGWMGWGFFFRWGGFAPLPLRPSFPSLLVFGSRRRAMARFALSPTSTSIFPLPALRSAPAKPSLKITSRIWFVATGTSPSPCFKRERPKYSREKGKI